MRPTPGLVIALTLVAAGGSPWVTSAQTPPCAFRGAPSALLERPSPLDSVVMRLGDAEGKLCYGRPSAEGAPRVGLEFPFGSPWQMGANEPTTLHLPFPARVGSVDLGPGSYSLYAIPAAGDWTIVVNGNPDRWGAPIGADVRAADIGSFRSTPTPTGGYVERLTFAFEPSGPAAGTLVYSWEGIRVAIPLVRR